MKIEVKRPTSRCALESVPPGDVFGYNGAFFLMSEVNDLEAICVNLGTGSVFSEDVETEVEHYPDAKVVIQ